jgi:hypothetical protein
MPERYALVDATNVVVGIALWDGVEPWTPPDGSTPIQVNAQMCDTGYTYDSATGLFSPPVPE